jgi:hypothetical protein
VSEGKQKSGACAPLTNFASLERLLAFSQLFLGSQKIFQIFNFVTFKVISNSSKVPSPKSIRTVMDLINLPSNIPYSSTYIPSLFCGDAEEFY